MGLFGFRAKKKKYAAQSAASSAQAVRRADPEPEPTHEREVESSNSAPGIPGLQSLFNGLSFGSHTNRIIFDRDYKNGTGSLSLDHGQDIDIIVKENEDREGKSTRPSHRVYRVNERNRLHEIGALWENTSRAGDAYYGLDVKVFQQPFKGFLWPVKGSSTAWRIVESTARDDDW